MSIKAILWESPKIQEISIKWLFMLPCIRKKLPAAGFAGAHWNKQDIKF